ncbi:hypothetical protein ABW19_dt0209257 [Dactylella cylindrospora]|nr:hypothetical protein ABW19_dt0209257 [Dactylella cylindrospora]
MSLLQSSEAEYAALRQSVFETNCHVEQLKNDMAEVASKLRQFQEQELVSNLCLSLRAISIRPGTNPAVDDGDKEQIIGEYQLLLDIFCSRYPIFVSTYRHGETLTAAFNKQMKRFRKWVGFPDECDGEEMMRMTEWKILRQIFNDVDALAGHLMELKTVVNNLRAEMRSAHTIKRLLTGSNSGNVEIIYSDLKFLMARSNESQKFAAGRIAEGPILSVALPALFQHATLDQPSPSRSGYSYQAGPLKLKIYRMAPVLEVKSIPGTNFKRLRCHLGRQLVQPSGKRLHWELEEVRGDEENGAEPQQGNKRQRVEVRRQLPTKTGRPIKKATLFRSRVTNPVPTSVPPDHFLSYPYPHPIPSRLSHDSVGNLLPTATASSGAELGFLGGNQGFAYDNPFAYQPEHSRR